MQPKIIKIMQFVRRPKMVLNPFNKKYYPEGHFFDDPFAEMRKNHNLKTEQ